MSHSPSEDGPGNWPTPNRAGSGGGGRHPTGGSGSGNGGADNEGGSNKGQPGVPPYQAPQAEPVVERFDPHLVWRKVLSDLAIQMPAGSYDTWVRDTWVMGFEDGEFIIGLPNAYARDWLENRLRASIKRKLQLIMGRSMVQVTFRVQAKPVTDGPNARPVPLYENGWDTKREGGTPARAESTRSDVSEQAGPSEPKGSAQPPVPTRSPALNLGRPHRTERSDPAEPAERTDAAVAAGQGNGFMSGAMSAPLPASFLGTNSRYTFENFVVGSHNRLAHAAALAVSENPGQRFNPLFIYGGVGLGKTHLLHAIANRMSEKGAVVVYVTSEQFTNEFISAIRAQNNEQFREKYRAVDALLVDDIQFISGKETTQEEFFHTFNHLHAMGKQVVLSSDRPPKAIATLEERLRSRFEGGIQTDISSPDFETRVAILQSKAERMGIHAPQDVLMLVAERVESNIRELEGALNHLWVQANLRQSTLTLDVATAILDNLAPRRTICSPQRVVQVVAGHFGLTQLDLTGRKRTADIASARQVAMYLLREESQLSLPAIGELLGGRDHSTVRYGVERVSEDLRDNDGLRRDVAALREKLYMPGE